MPRKKKSSLVRGYEELPDGRRIYYTKTFHNGSVFTTYGPPPDSIDPDEEDCTCRLIKRQKNKSIKWSFYGPRETLLRGKLARTILQGRWDDPHAMAVLNAAYEIRKDGGDNVSKSIWQGAQDTAKITKERSARKLVKLAEKFDGTLADDATLIRAYRIALAVKYCAKKNNRLPTVMEVLTRFEEGEPDALPLGTFYRDLHRAGWGWLARP